MSLSDMPCPRFLERFVCALLHPCGRPLPAMPWQPTRIIYHFALLNRLGDILGRVAGLSCRPRCTLELRFARNLDHIVVAIKLTRRCSIAVFGPLGRALEHEPERQ